MVRGSEIIFTAILSVVFLHRRLNKLNVAGLVLCLLGILTVAAATVLDARKAGAAANGGPTAGQTIVGMLLILLSELVQASQVVAEDYLMSSAPQKIHPVELVGYEGLFGAGVMLAVVLPLAQISRIGPEGGGLREDSLETLGMLRNSHQLLSLYGTYIAIMAVYNITGMQVTEAMGALSRVVAETVRTMLIWGGDLWLYYNFRTKTARIGEPWTQYSWIEAVGFLVLVVGTASYGIGEERHAEKVRECLKRKARERWAMVRASMKHLAALHQELTEEERRLPFMPSRIAGPARFRISLRTLASRHRGRQRAAQEGEGGQVAEAGASP